MELTLNVILDELSVYNPVILKNSSKNIKFKRFDFFNSAITEINPFSLYLVNSAEFEVCFGQICPNHLIAIDSKR
jgi:hypothetical protein